MHLQTARWLCYFHRPQKAMTFHRPHTVSKVDTIRKLYRFVFAYLQYHRTFSENQKQQLAQCSVSYIIPSPIHITLPKKKHGPRGLKGIETYWNHMIISKTSTSPRLPLSLPVAEHGKSAAPLAAAFPHRAPGQTLREPLPEGRELCRKPHGNPSVSHGFPWKWSTNGGCSWMFINFLYLWWFTWWYPNISHGWSSSCPSYVMKAKTSLEQGNWW